MANTADIGGADQKPRAKARFAEVIDELNRTGWQTARKSGVGRWYRRQRE